MEQEVNQRIKRIHDTYPIVDGHFDLLIDVARKRELGYKQVIETDHLPEFQAGGVNIIVSSIYIEDEFLPEMGLRKALDQISALYAEIDESPDKIMLCKSYGDLLQARAQQKLGIILSFEGVDPLGNDLNLLRIFYELGVRGIGLVWSRRNFAADGCHFFPKREGQRGGLTPFGVALIEEAERLGMFIDVSHLNDEGFWDVMAVTQKPVIASHSNCRAVTDVARNLTDDQIKALAARHGVIGMNSASRFVADRDEDSNVDSLVRHVDHLVKLVGVEYIGLGFDLCDFLRARQPRRAVESPRKAFDVIKGHKNIGQFTAGLIQHGYNDDEIGLILGGNFLRLYETLM